MSAAAEARVVPLERLLSALPEKDLRGPIPAEIRGLTDDSRHVTAGGCFVAVRGLRVDGHRFMPALHRLAESAGAEERIIEGADHFFFGKLYPLGEAIGAWVAGLPRPP